MISTAGAPPPYPRLAQGGFAPNKRSPHTAPGPPRGASPRISAPPIPPTQVGFAPNERLRWKQLPLDQPPSVCGPDSQRREGLGELRSLDRNARRHAARDPERREEVDAAVEARRFEGACSCRRRWPTSAPRSCPRNQEQRLVVGALGACSRRRSRGRARPRPGSLRQGAAPRSPRRRARRRRRRSAPTGSGRPRPPARSRTISPKSAWSRGLARSAPVDAHRERARRRRCGCRWRARRRRSPGRARPRRGSTWRR